MPPRFAPDLKDIDRTDLAAMSREELEDLAWRLHELARALANRAGEDSRTSSRPPSSDDPYRRDGRGAGGADRLEGGGEAEISPAAPEKAGKSDDNGTAKPAGKRPGEKGCWRSRPIVVSGEAEHAPTVCSRCGAALGGELERRCVSAHNTLELARRHVVASRRDQTRLLRRALPMRSRDRVMPRRRSALACRGS